MEMAHFGLRGSTSARLAHFLGGRWRGLSPVRRGVAEPWTYGSCYRTLVFALLLVVLSGCAHIPKESAQLSQELTGMINAAQTAHLNLVEGYIQERRTRVDDFLKAKWIDLLPDSWTFLKL